MRDIPTHSLKIIINKCKGGELMADGQTIYQNLDPDERINLSDVGIDTSGTVPPPLPAPPQVLDLTGPELYQNDPDIFDHSPNRPLTFLSIPNSTLYAQHVPKNSFVINKGGQKTSKHLADVTGSDFKYFVGSYLTLETSVAPNLIPPIEIEAGCVYEIIFDNTCVTPSSGDAATDFSCYSTLFKSSVEASFVVPGDGNKTGSCHRAVASDLASFNSLAELLRPLSGGDSSTAA